jgi:hypothetical protein
MQRRLCAAILFFEAIAFGLSTPVLFSLTSASTRTVLLVGPGLTIGCILVAGLLRYRFAFVLGWALQVAAIVTGFLVPAMFFLGALFLALWATAYFMGQKIETERAEWERTGQYPGAPTES